MNADPDPATQINADPDQANKNLISSCKFFSILAHDTLDPDPESGSAIRKNAVSGSEYPDPQPWLQDLGPEAWQQLGQHGVQEADFHFREFRSAQRQWYF